MEELWFLAHFPWLPQFAFIFYLSYTTQDHLLRDGMAHSGLGSSHISQESRKCPQTLDCRQYNKRNPSAKMSSFHMAPICVKFTKN